MLSSMIPSEISMSELTPLEGNPRFRWDAVVNGKKYPESISSSPGSAYSYDIKKLFNKLSVSVGVNDNDGRSSESAGIIFIIEGDGKTLYRSKEMKAGDALHKISVDISGIDKIILKASSQSESSRRRFGPAGNWINPILTK